jgi:hypothetical protein
MTKLCVTKRALVKVVPLVFIPSIATSLAFGKDHKGLVARQIEDLVTTLLEQHQAVAT